MDPGDATAHLRDHLDESNRRQQREIQRNEMRAGTHKRLGGKCAVALAELTPRAAMNEHMNRRVRCRTSIDIQRLSGRRPIGEDIRLAYPRTDLGAVFGVAANDLDGVRRPGPLTVLAIKRRLIVV